MEPIACNGDEDEPNQMESMYTFAFHSMEVQVYGRSNWNRHQMRRGLHSFGVLRMGKTLRRICVPCFWPIPSVLWPHPAGGTADISPPHPEWHEHEHELALAFASHTHIGKKKNWMESGGKKMEEGHVKFAQYFETSGAKAKIVTRQKHISITIYGCHLLFHFRKGFVVTVFLFSSFLSRCAGRYKPLKRMSFFTLSFPTSDNVSIKWNRKTCHLANKQWVMGMTKWWKPKRQRKFV